MSVVKNFFLFVFSFCVCNILFLQVALLAEVSSLEAKKIMLENISQGEIQKIPVDWEEQNITLSEKISAIAVQIPNKREVEISLDSGLSWQEFLIDIDEKTFEGSMDSQLLFFDTPVQYFQFRVLGKKNFSDSIAKINFFFLGIQSGQNTLAANDSISIANAGYSYDTNFFSQYDIIPRKDWGANESIRYKGETDKKPTFSSSRPLTEKEIGCEQIQTRYPEDFIFTRKTQVENGKKLKWPYRYSPYIKKIVVHHTASNSFTDTNKSAEEVMRATYAYHTNGRGWGDIGYNFIIAPDGKIFEGRAGGDYVVGGHVYCANVQTVGVSLMGNFNTKNPTAAQAKALQNLLGGLAKKYNIDTSAESSFHGTFTSNVVGHKDYGHTACPGDHLYELLPLIREGIDLSGLSFAVKKLFKRAALFTGNVEIRKIEQGKKEKYTLTFENTGNSVWDSSTWLFADFPSTDISIVPVDGKNIFYAAGLKESFVAPGSVGTFEVEIVAGSDTGLHTIEFTPVVDARRIKQGAIVVPVITENANFSADLQHFSTGISGDKKTLSVEIFLQNSGNTVWLPQNNLLKVQLANELKFFKMEEESVLPGAIAHFKGNISVEQKESLPFLASLRNQKSKIAKGSLVKKKIYPLGRSALEVETNFREILKASFTSGKKILSRMKKNSLPQKYFVAINTGNITWKRGEVVLEVRAKNAKKKWETKKIHMLEGAVKPGETATFFVQSERKFSGRTQKFKMQLRKNDKKIRGGKVTWYVKSIVTGDNQLKNNSNVPIYTPLVTHREEDKIISIPSNTTENIRIRLSYQNDNALVEGENVALYVDGKKVATSANSFAIEQAGNTVTVNGRTGKIIQVKSKRRNTPVILSSWNNTPAWDASLNDNQFLGTLEFRVYNNQFIAINELPIEDYLKGLGEVSNSAPIEKQKAIAVVARSYAQYYMSNQYRKYPGAPYDGDDSPASFQKYLGYGYQLRSPNFSHAVDATKGKVVYYNGQLVKTPFFSESDGRTKSAQEVWGWTTTPYLVSVGDSFCKSGAGTLKGHGVGLSGCGAEEMARLGKTYQEILQYYYSGVEVR